MSEDGVLNVRDTNLKEHIIVKLVKCEYILWKSYSDFDSNPVFHVRCVTKMDHHCPWTYNCVGLNNMPHFFRFLIWVDITSGYGFYRLVLRCIEFYQIRNLPSYMVPRSQLVMTILLVPFTFFILFSVGALTIRVILNTANGYTQIETWEEDRLTSAKRRGLVPRNARFPYDLGLYENFVATLGPIYTWPLPWGRPPVIAQAKALNIPVKFERNESGYDENGKLLTWPPDMQTVEPPQEYFDKLKAGIPQPEPESTSRTPMTFAQTALLKEQKLASNSENSNAYSESRNGGKPLPLWRRIRSDNDFYNREHWTSFEGEKLSDFGVDLDSELLESNYPLPDTNRHQHTFRSKSDTNHLDFDDEDSLFSPELARKYENNYVRQSTPQNFDMSFMSGQQGLRAAGPISSATHSSNLLRRSGLQTENTGEYTISSSLSNEQGSQADVNEDDLPLAKLLARKRQEKSKLKEG